MDSNLKLGFEFSNAFSEKSDELPLFMRQDGIRGCLRLGNPSGEEVEKVKLILRGMAITTVDSNHAHTRRLLIQHHRSWVSGTIFASQAEGHPKNTTYDRCTGLVWCERWTRRSRGRSLRFQFPAPEGTLCFGRTFQQWR